MQDLIDKAKLLNTLCKECGHCKNMEEAEQGSAKPCSVHRIISEQPTIEPEVRHGRWIPTEYDGWIPCSERLPENDAKCLVYTSDKRICMARWYGKYDEQGAWYIISDDVPKLYRIKNVPFWMPLPEPPKE